MNPNLKYQLHPWHGVEIGENAPTICTAFIEIVPTDTIKYEVDKPSGLIKVDRPQKYSNIFPSLYGFIPQTLCDIEVGNFCMDKTGRTGIIGDQDQADDKIVAIMKGDEVYGSWHDITDVNEAILMRLKHYFLTYKKGPNDSENKVQIDGIYGREEAYKVIRRSQKDYQNKFLIS